LTLLVEISTNFSKSLLVYPDVVFTCNVHRVGLLHTTQWCVPVPSFLVTLHLSKAPIALSTELALSATSLSEYRCVFAHAIVPALVQAQARGMQTDEMHRRRRKLPQQNDDDLEGMEESDDDDLEGKQTYVF